MQAHEIKLTHYQYVLLLDLDQYLAQGWAVTGPGPNLGGWTSVIVR